ncbi:HAMP domain-containing histidine kinase [archaeon]|nr:MAG: HAMP domain-containing histidine kinase [archaeon]
MSAFVSFPGIFILVSVVLIMEVHRQSYALFFTHRKLSDALKERQQAADEENATEMRHMIANVAHDLKTVSLCYPLSPLPNRIYTSNY